MRYCSFCGKLVEEGQLCNCRNEAKPKLDKQTLIKRAIVFGGLALIAILCIVLVVIFAWGNLQGDPPGSGSLELINPFDFVVDVTFDGLDGYGEINISYDQDALIERFIGKEPNINDEKAVLNWLAQYMSFDSVLEFVSSSETGLSNGDTVTVTCVVPNEAKDRLKQSSKQYTVSGLETPQIIDVFAEIEICYEGISGGAQASIKKLSNATTLSDCDFEISPNYNLSNGDQITIRLSDNSIKKLSKNHKTIPQTTSKTYMVKRLSEYVSSVEQLPKETIKQFAKRFYDEKKASLQYDGYFTYENITYCGTYFYLQASEQATLYKNILRIDVSYDMYMHGNHIRTDHTYLDFPNITIDSTGMVSLVYENGNSLSSSINEDGYIITKID